MTTPDHARPLALPAATTVASDDTPPAPDCGRPVVQPHGGALLPGGRPGNRGGIGSPPAYVRERLRGSFLARLKVLEEIADNVGPVIIEGQRTGERAAGYGTARDRDRIAALDLLARYGGIVSHALSADDVRDRLRATVDAIREELPPEQAAPLLAVLRRIWSE